MPNGPLPIVSGEFVEMTRAAFPADPEVSPERLLGQQDVLAFLGERLRLQTCTGGHSSRSPELSNRKCVSTVLGEICDDRGQWITGCLTFGRLAETIGTTTADLMRRLVMLRIVEMKDGRHRLTREAIRKQYGTVNRRRGKGKGSPDIRIDLMLPDGMVFVVTNLEATNLAETDAEILRRNGMSLSQIAQQLGCSKQAVHKRLAGRPPRLTNWKIVGSWAERKAANDDNHIVNLSVPAA